MSKSKIFLRDQNNRSVITRTSLKNVLFNKYYSLYLNNYEFEGDIDYQQKEYILKRFWGDGRIACFKLKELEGSKAHPQGVLVFCPFAPGYWNIYDYPVKVNLINTRGVRFIPTGLQVVDEDVVIGFAQRNKKPIMEIVNNYLERMVDVLMVIRMNLKTHKMPWLIGGTPEEHAKLKTLFDKLETDDTELFIDSEDIDKFKALVSGAPYIIDKLSNYYCAIENELREFLGFQNLGVGEKKEHLITSEVQANNSLVEANQDCLLDTMKEFFERIKDLFGIDIKVSVKQSSILPYEEESELEKDVQEQEDF